MPFEIIADFKSAGLTGTDLKWAGFAANFVQRMLKHEPKLRIVLRNLPAPGTPKHTIVRLKKAEVHASFGDRLEVPEGKSYLVRQYFCKTCGEPGKGKWFPRAYAALHAGHEIEQSAPTGRAERFPWAINFRMFLGSPERLDGTVPGLPSVAITTDTNSNVDLSRFDWMFLIPSEAGALRNKRSAEMTHELCDLAAAPKLLVDWMCKQDPKALDDGKEEAAIADLTTTDAIASPEEIERVQKRLMAAKGLIASKIRQQQMKVKTR